jgi:hypothetical protein
VNGNIYVMQDNGHLVAMQEQAYDSEAVLQTLLAHYPTLLAGEQMDRADPRRWIVVAQEVGLPTEDAGADRWSVDHLLLDQDGVPTLVEVKRSSDTRIRREVVGQMLDYAAHAVLYWSIDKLRTTFAQTCATQGGDPVQALEALLGPAVDQEQFWQQVQTNLQLGKIRMVFVADSIPPELQRIVEFLNSQMTPAEVVAVEIRQYVGQGLKTLVPRVVGQTVEAHQKKVSGPREGRPWDEASFFQELATRRGSNEATIARKILAWAQTKQLRLWWGQGKQDGSFFPMFDYQGKKYWLIAVWTYGRIEIQFQMMKTSPPFEAEAKRVELLQRLNALPGVTIPPDAITRRPSIRLSVVQDETVLQQFLAICDWIIQEITASGAQQST